MSDVNTTSECAHMDEAEYAQEGMFKGKMTDVEMAAPFLPSIWSVYE